MRVMNLLKAAFPCLFFLYLLGCGASLISVVKKGDIEQVRTKLEKGANVNETEGKQDYSQSALAVAADSGYTDIVKLLLEKGADPNDPKGGNPLNRAARKGHIEIVQALIDKGVVINNENKCEALILASEYGHIEIVKLLLKKGADVNAKNYNEETALMIAAQNNHESIVKTLISNSADVNYMNKNMRTALMEVVEKGNIDMIKCLLENGANANPGGYFISVFTKSVNDVPTEKRISIETFTALDLAKNTEIKSLLRKWGAKERLKFESKIDNNAFVEPLIWGGYRNYSETFYLNEHILQEALNKKCTSHEVAKFSNLLRTVGVSEAMIRYFEK